MTSYLSPDSVEDSLTLGRRECLNSPKEEEQRSVKGFRQDISYDHLHDIPMRSACDRFQVILKAGKIWKGEFGAFMSPFGSSNPDNFFGNRSLAC